MKINDNNFSNKKVIYLFIRGLKIIKITVKFSYFFIYLFKPLFSGLKLFIQIFARTLSLVFLL